MDRFVDQTNQIKVITALATIHDDRYVPYDSGKLTVRVSKGLDYGEISAARSIRQWSIARDTMIFRDNLMTTQILIQ